MKALILDFDGVIADSAKESFLVAVQAYLHECPKSLLVHRKSRELYQPFRDLMPLGNRAEDFGTALAALEKELTFEDQEAYDRFRAKQDPLWLAQFHSRFYRVRATMAERDPDRWRALMRPFPPLLEFLRRRAGQTAYAIATAKDRPSVEALLEDYGATDLFPGHLILDKETGETKAAHLERLRELLGVEYAEMTFVDDKVNHLDAVASLGVRCALATWGFNGMREHELAIRRGYLMLTLENLDEKLFDKVPATH